MVIPYQCVQKLTGSNERYIYVNDNGTARRVFVQLGERYDDKIEIVSDGVNPGDEIVVTGAEKLVDGVKLKINR
jgi:multidrug efflux pump subunit AcrA (membrane-fusion protein)